MICQICLNKIYTKETDPKEMSCSICHMSFHLHCVNSSDNENPHSGQADNIWYCAKCLSLPCRNLNDPEFKIVKFKIVKVLVCLSKDLKRSFLSSHINPFKELHSCLFVCLFVCFF